MQTGQLITDFRTLNSLARAGYVVLNGKPGQTERHWTGRPVKIVTVSRGPKLRYETETFTHRAKTYRVKYFDGCFCPFVVRLDVTSPMPSFV